MSQGIVYLVGAGPGDPGLLTRRAWELIRKAEVIVYDYLVDERLIEDCSESCERVYVGKQARFHSISQEEIQAILVDRAQAGKCVVRLKGGDPFVFGRGGEEVRQLGEANINFEIVPGVTAALAGAAYLGLPLTHRDHSSSLCLLTGHENPEKQLSRVHFRDFAKLEGTLCIYMGMGQLSFIVSELMAGGLPVDTPATVVQWAALPRQRSVAGTLETLPQLVGEQQLEAPAMIYVGKVACFEKQFAWFESKPLFGKRIVVTRTRSQSGKLRGLLEEAGAEVLELPLIRITPEADLQQVQTSFRTLGHYDWLMFTSCNGVRQFFKHFYQHFDDIRSLGFIKLAAVGEATTQAIAKHCLRVDFTPDGPHPNALALAHALIERENIANTKCLVITGNRNDPGLANQLEASGAMVDTLPLYKTESNDLSKHPAAAQFCAQGADAVTFASSSAVDAFIAQADHLKLHPEAKRPIFASIGPSTSASLRAARLPLAVEASSTSLPSLVDALINSLSQRQN